MRKEGGWTGKILYFEMLLRAIYNQPYIVTPSSLIAVTELADYYCALPVLSRSLDGAFFRNTNFINELFCALSPICIGNLLYAAIKLRHPPLYRDCLAISIGPWHDPFFHGFADRKMEHASERLYNQVGAQVAKVHLNLLAYCTEHSSEFDSDVDRDHASHFWQKLRDMGREVREREEDIQISLGGGPRNASLSLPTLYREVYDTELSHNTPITVIVSDLMGGNLMLDRSLLGGLSDCRDHFLCGWVEDEDLPWDPAENDW
jgi:hypothetical protein